LTAQTTDTLNNYGLVTLSEPTSAAAEAYRLLCTNVQYSNTNNTNTAKSVHSILVTSARPNENKSEVVANLAVVFAQLDNRVILVDADLRRPSLHRFFGLSNDSGLTSYIHKTTTTTDSTPNSNGYANGSSLPLVQTSVANLRLLTAGPTTHNPAEVLGSAAMRNLLNQLQAESDIVLFDVPPVLAVTDASILAPRVDGVIMVFRSGHTKRQDTQAAKEQLQKVHANILGAVLSNVKGRQNSAGY
jgi:non-specific protein-tyrosine kinase